MLRILVTVSRDPDRDNLTLRRDYVRRLRQAGGLPLLLPHDEAPISPDAAESCLAGCAGLLLSGGGDLEPGRYGAAPGADADVDRERDQAEFALVEAAWQRRLPIFGICRGLQLINVALGGDLYQDMDAELGRGNRLHWHGSEERYDCHHRVAVVRPELARLIGRSAKVNSHHHQGLRRLAPPLLAAAYAPDGLCEAVIGREGRPLLAVQWHPECLETMAPLFTAFVGLCQSFWAGDD